jgi:hypothetical protein
MTVDIFFVKKLPFLLGVFISLGLSMCVHLKNRGTECVASDLASFLTTVSNRGCVIIKTDGEGAVGVMAPTLNSKGIVVETYGPGQHVPVVETMSDEDDMEKLTRLLGYILGTPHKGITFKIGNFMSLNVFIDAAYGVLKESGKSHTGCAIMLGEGGPLYVKDCDQAKHCDQVDRRTIRHRQPGNTHEKFP